MTWFLEHSHSTICKVKQMNRHLATQRGLKPIYRNKDSVLEHKVHYHIIVLLHWEQKLNSYPLTIVVLYDLLSNKTASFICALPI